MRELDLHGDDMRQTKFNLSGDQRRRLEFIRRATGERSAAHAIRAWIANESARLGYSPSPAEGGQ